MFNPTNLNKVCVEATHSESKWKNVDDKFSLIKSNQSKEGKRKWKGFSMKNPIYWKIHLLIEVDNPLEEVLSLE